MRLSSYLGHYKTTVDGLSIPSIRPQENGVRGGIRYFSVTDGGGTGLRFSAEDRLLHIGARKHTVEQVAAAAHAEDLPEGKTVQVAVDGFYGGLGSNSCGPLPFAPYRLNPERDTELRFKFGITPIRKV
jgi:hypothetical protein